MQATVAAPRAKVWVTMFHPDHYATWTAPFAPGGCYEGNWEKGSRMRFLAPNGDGMLAEIAECRPHERMAIRHIGVVAEGVEDTGSDAVKPWAPAYESYGFRAVTGGTEVRVDQEVTEDIEESMRKTWGQALAIVAELCEGKATGA